MLLVAVLVKQLNKHGAGKRYWQGQTADESAWAEAVPIRIGKLPAERYVEGFDLAPYKVGMVYEVGKRLAELLIVAGCATPELRRVNWKHAADRPHARRRWTDEDD